MDGARMKTTSGESYRHDLELLLNVLSTLIVAYVDSCFQPGAKVIDYKRPEELKQLLDLTLPTSPAALDHVLELFQQTIDYSPKTMHPLFMDKLYAGTTPVGVAVELLTAALNVNAHVYQTSPVGTMMELACMQEVRGIIGYPTNDGCGLMSPGGSMSNLIAMCTARNHLFPSVKTEGLCKLPQLAVFTSAQSHYSIDKAAMLLGIGLDNVFRVDCTLNGQMLVADLESKIELALSRSMRPFFINATSGTTVMCGFDPLREIAQVAKKHKLWFHVDGSWGGALVFSPKYKYLLDGIELSDSFTINPHKMLGVPLQCSCLLLSHPSQVMATANATVANYLFHGNKHDLGRLGIGCGRRADAVKWFLSWKWEGTIGFQNRVENAMSMANLFRNRVRKSERLELVIIVESNDPSTVSEITNNSTHDHVTRNAPRTIEHEMGANVCFWYVRRDMEIKAGGRKQWREEAFSKEQPREFTIAVDASTKLIQKEMIMRGMMMIDYSPLSSPYSLPTFFRLPFNAPTVTEKHLDFIIEEITSLGDRLFP